MEPAWWELAFFIGISLLFRILAVPLIKRQVEPNMFYGFRTKKTMSSPDMWYPANEYCGELLLCMSYLLTASAIILFFVPGMEELLYLEANSGVVLVSLFVSMALNFHYLKKL